MSKLKKIALYLGFTQVEFNTALFLSIVFIIGAVLTFIKRDSSYAELKKYDYAAKDSAFYKTISGDADVKDAKAEMKTVPDSSSFTFHPVSVKKRLTDKSINLNKATAEELETLPGIGSKTAAKILELRKSKGRFNSIDELKEINGIGDSKLEKISKYIYIE